MKFQVRDWVDIIHCHSRLQSFGCLVWATCGKDPGLSPKFILEQAGRSALFLCTQCSREQSVKRYLVVHHS